MDNNIELIGLNEIVPGDNDRTKFDKASLKELADNIEKHGLIQPITIRPLADTGLYQIVAGERRYRACSLLQWDTVPAIIKDLSEEEASAVMLMENMSRQDLDPIDEAFAYAKRIETFGWSIAEVSRAAGVSEIRVQFRLKLLNIREDLQALIRSGDLSLGYAQILADSQLDNNRQLIAIARLRENAHPTPAWFRRMVGQLSQEQLQENLFEMPLTIGYVQAIEPIESVEPPHPSTTTPPQKGNTVSEKLQSQVLFWQEAARAWNQLGKPFKRQECEAAAQALGMAMATI